MKKILITGGCGYTGSVLTEDLIKQGFRVTIIDTQWFGKNLKKNKNLKIIKGDIRYCNPKIFKNIDVVVHLANIANDPSVELNPQLSWEVNVLATKRILEHSVRNKVKKFIFASSGSVYGIKKEKKVTEDLNLLPISTYNKTKMIAERVLKSFENDIKIYSIRPATVCGLSKRMRFDVSVNMFVFQALKNKKITVFGGQQIRPNIHIKDLSRVYQHFIKKNLKTGFYNAGFENLKILKIAKFVKNKINCKIELKKNFNDPRSYRQNSDKLILTGFKPMFSVKDEIEEVKSAYISKRLKNSKKFFTVNWMKKLKIS